MHLEELEAIASINKEKNKEAEPTGDLVKDNVKISSTPAVPNRKSSTVLKRINTYSFVSSCFGFTSHEKVTECEQSGKKMVSNRDHKQTIDLLKTFLVTCKSVTDECDLFERDKRIN